MGERSRVVLARVASSRPEEPPFLGAALQQQPAKQEAESGTRGAHCQGRQGLPQ